MLFYITLKQTTSKHAIVGDTLEQTYLDYFATHANTPQGSVFMAVANHLENTKQLLKKYPPDCIIITGGNNIDIQATQNILLDDLAPRRDQVETMLYLYAKQHQVPVLAICRGFQLINLLEGGQLSAHLANHPPGQDHEVEYQQQVFTVNSYHSHGIFKPQLAPNLEAIALAKGTDLVEAYRGKNHPMPLLAVQWHPERLTTHDQLFSILYQAFLANV